MFGVQGRRGVKDEYNGIVLLRYVGKFIPNCAASRPSYQFCIDMRFEDLVSGFLVYNLKVVISIS